MKMKQGFSFFYKGPNSRKGDSSHSVPWRGSSHTTSVDRPES